MIIDTKFVELIGVFLNYLRFVNYYVSSLPADILRGATRSFPAKSKFCTIMGVAGHLIKVQSGSGFKHSDLRLN